jgi:hypothetical protein
MPFKGPQPETSLEMPLAAGDAHRGRTARHHRDAVRAINDGMSASTQKQTCADQPGISPFGPIGDIAPFNQPGALAMRFFSALFVACRRRLSVWFYETRFMPGGFHVPSLGGRIEGGSVFGQYSRNTSARPSMPRRRRRPRCPVPRANSSARAVRCLRRLICWREQPGQLTSNRSADVCVAAE